MAHWRASQGATLETPPAILRRRSTRGFHEPIAALLAILVLWCYNQLINEQSKDGRASDYTSDYTASKRGSVVRLEQSQLQALQAWQDGHPGFKPHLQGVGDIERPGAGFVILEMGRRMIMEMNIGPLSNGLAAWLRKLSSQGSKSKGLTDRVK